MTIFLIKQNDTPLLLTNAGRGLFPTSNEMRALRFDTREAAQGYIERNLKPGFYHPAQMSVKGQAELKGVA